MECPYCRFQVENGSAFCPICGRALVEGTENPYASTVAQEAMMRGKIAEGIQGPLMLAICILVSAAALFTFDVLYILFTIFLWIAFAAAKKGTLSGSHLRNVSGALFAQCIMGYISAGLMFFFGLLSHFALSYMQDYKEFYYESFYESLEELEDMVGEELLYIYEGFLEFLMEIPPVVFMLIFFVVGVIGLVVTLFGLRYIHHFAKSLYHRYDDGETPLRRVSAAKGWLMVLGILNCISAFSGIANPISFLTSAAIGAAMILGSVLVSKLDFE